MNFLAIDPSSLATGWALRTSAGKVEYGTWKLKKAGEKVGQGVLYLRLWREILSLIKQHDIDPAELKIAIEAPSMNAVGGGEWKQVSERFGGIIHLLAAFKGVDGVSEPVVNSWRSAFIGRASAPKEIQDTEARRAWIKEEVIKACKMRGMSPKNDNEADAIGILFWLMHGGDAVVAQRKADKKAATAAKRAQARMAV